MDSSPGIERTLMHSRAVMMHEMTSMARITMRPMMKLDMVIQTSSCEIRRFPWKINENFVNFLSSGEFVKINY